MHIENVQAILNFVLILLFSCNVVAVILGGESNCCHLRQHFVPADADKVVVLALILFFYMHTLFGHLACLPRLFLCSVTVCFLRAFTFR